MKSLIGVLSLAIVLVYSQAEEPHGCEKTLGPEELQQVDGDWVMVWSVWDKLKAQEHMFPNVTSSHLELRVQPDHHTLVAYEQNIYSEGKCVSYTFNLTLPQTREGHNRLDLEGAVETKDGEVKEYTEKFTAEFYPSSENTMKLLYKNEKYGEILVVYRREGQHLDHLDKDYEEHRTMAKCLNLQGDNFEEWHYEGADFCHKKSALPTLDSEQLHQVDGDWVLVWMAYNKNTSQDFNVSNLTSSHMEISVQPDKHTLVLHERNLMGGKCVSYKANLVLPQNSEGIHRLNMEGGKEIIEGKEEPYEYTATAEFFPSSENTMKMLHKSDHLGPFLLMYRREGQHLDHLERDHEEYKKMAKYLGLTGKDFDEWHYDGEADFCHKKSVLPTLDSEELNKVEGDWVLVWMAYDKIKTQDDPFMNLTSSHIEMRVQADKHTVVLHERNVVEGKCISYKGNLVLPQNSERIHRLNWVDVTKYIDEVEQPYSDTATAEFFITSDNKMEMFFKCGHFGDFLLMYMREGHHRDVTELEKDHEAYKAKAKYLGLSGKNFDEWHYDGVTDFCHKKSAPES